MTSQDELMQQIMDKVSDQVAKSIKTIITETVEKELTASLSKALVQSEFYRQVNDDMRTGLSSIYKEIAAATRPDQAPSSDMVGQKEAKKLFSEATRQLDEILTSTEQATGEIMDIVEERQVLQEKSSELLGKLRKTRKHNENILELIAINDELSENLMRIMTALSFQDLTGQRIKKIITALKRIEHTVFDLYVSTGMILRAHEENPEKNLEELKKETQGKVSELKGPSTSGMEQGGVDDLLSQLGLE